ncbi:DUF3836 domain-containing protein [Dysgonomonas sp. Marseille-P4361]|uniref:DUF3836 domain-containing protein n=1 Tax=Dysgonomonas sp. Marseille-P4361 TaxID=2161820 RepID=UPI000D5542DB|nr:DUF3836 domain-containing protein [Dysgonomonas sp. Marseille-P4361]
MKATILTTVFAALVLSISVNAQNVNRYSNVKATEFGTEKECISVDSKTLTPLIKQNYSFDADGKMIEKVISRWDGIDNGWVNVSKYEYTYTDADSDLISLIAYTKWNKAAKDWSSESDLLVNVYDENNNYLATGYEK